MILEREVRETIIPPSLIIVKVFWRVSQSTGPETSVAGVMLVREPETTRENV